MGRVRLITLSGAQGGKFAIHLVEETPGEFRCKVYGAIFKTDRELQEHVCFAKRFTK